MEQMLGTQPYRFEAVDADHARIVESERKGFFGGWGPAKGTLRWVACAAVQGESGTSVVVEAGGGAAPLSRALQLVQLLQRGVDDRRTVYRDRTIPDGAVTLVASWAGTGYRLFEEPRLDAPRGATIHTATGLVAIPGGLWPFTHVRLPDGTEGYVERDQIVAAPSVATRSAQAETARFG